MYSDKITKFLKDRKIGAGDRVLVKKGGLEVEGDLMPKPDVGDENTLIIKMKNGYNVGISFEGASITKISAGTELSVFPKSKLKARDDLPKVSLIYTGGTIGTTIDYKTGGVYMALKPEELFYKVPEISEIASVEMSNPFSIASEDISYLKWQALAKEIAASLNKGSRGAVITHGTDTMHYTAAVLSFMLEGLNGPVMLTGAQRSSDRGSSDAFMNLISSITVAARSDIAEVGICMHATSSDTQCSIIRGVRSRKMHTSRRDAFHSINDRPLGYVKADGAISYTNKFKEIEKGAHKVKAMTDFDDRIALVKAYPGSDPELLEFYAGKGCHGMIIEGTGLGHVPVDTEKKERSWLPVIKRLVDKGLVIGMTSQCLYGRTNKYVYRNLRLVSDAGVVYCEDMTPETAYVKLGWLLGNYDKEKARELLNKNIRGEISARSTYDSFMV